MQKKKRYIRNACGRKKTVNLSSKQFICSAADIDSEFKQKNGKVLGRMNNKKWSTVRRGRPPSGKRLDRSRKSCNDRSPQVVDERPNKPRRRSANVRHLTGSRVTSAANDARSTSNSDCPTEVQKLDLGCFHMVGFSRIMLTHSY